MLDAVTIDCPYCGEPIELLVEPGEGPQRYVEDCQVCCRPITVTVQADANGDLSVNAGTQDDV